MAKVSMNEEKLEFRSLRPKSLDKAALAHALLYHNETERRIVRENTSPRPGTLHAVRAFVVDGSVLSNPITI